MNIQGEICMANLNTLLNLLLMHVFAFAKLLQNENANYKKAIYPKASPHLYLPAIYPIIAFLILYLSVSCSLSPLLIW